MGVKLVRGTQRVVARVRLRGFVLFLRGVLPGDRGGELGRNVGKVGRRHRTFGARGKYIYIKNATEMCGRRCYI